MVDRLPIAVLAGIVGWCLGWASALLSDWLDTRENPRPLHLYDTCWSATYRPERIGAGLGVHTLVHNG